MADHATTQRFASRAHGVRPEELRRHNLSTLLRYVHVHGPTSRAELTAAMGLNRSTIGALTSELVAAGLVREEIPAGHSGAGRPSLVVCPRPDRVYALAFYINVDYVQAARVGLGGVVAERRELFRRPGAYPLRTAVHQLAGFAEELVAGVSGQCVGVGVAFPGTVRETDGVVHFAPNLGWAGQPLGAALDEALGRYGPVRIGNDANLGVLAEHTRGSAAGYDNAIYLAGEVGVGSGIISGGVPMTGFGGYGGELGHMVVNPYGRMCRCGARGCWETEIGEAAILAAAGRPEDARASVKEVVAAARAGDQHALTALREVGNWVSIGISNVLNIFSPGVVVFGGLLRDLYPVLREQLTDHLAGHRMAALQRQVALVTPALGADSTLMGAAELAFHELLEDPQGALRC